MAGKRTEAGHPPGLPARYRITGLIGEGSFASVFKAVDSDEGRTVAIKMLHPERLRNYKDSRRFEREISVCRRLNHPSVIRVFSAMVGSESAYLVMEYLDADDLSDLLAAGRFDTGRSLAIIAQVASALDYIHRKGLVHRDIKPENIMVCRNENRVVLTDFNLVRLPFRSSLTGSGDTLGTPRYVAPEIIMGDDASSSSDIYAMGLVLYELLTGRSAFDQKAIGALLKAICEKPPPVPSSLSPGLDPALDSLVARCLAKRPADRFPSAAHFLEALAECGREGWKSVQAVRRHTPGLNRWTTSRFLHIGLKKAGGHRNIVVLAVAVLALLSVLTLMVLSR